MIQSDIQNNCCGCGVCEVICPVQAITLRQDSEGFYKPFINEDQCIGCTKCIKSCCYKKRLDTSIKSHNFKQECYAVKHKEGEVLIQSQSGGAFSAISDEILSKNGIIYGAAIEKDFSVAHRRAANKMERDYMRGSKYVQSDMHSCLYQMEQDLKNSKKVLFTGTACQCDAVGLHFSEYKESLILCDIICHGVPSPMVWKDYLIFKERQKRGKVEKVIFRDSAKFGWHDNQETLFINGRQFSGRNYASLFYSNYCLNNSCYTCPYATKQRISDITLGDFWGIENIIEDAKNDTTGISMLIVNSKKGKMLLDQIKKNLIINDCTNENWLTQMNLKKPTDKPLNRENFWKDYEKHGMGYMLSKYGAFSLRNRIKQKLFFVFRRSN